MPMGLEELLNRSDIPADALAVIRRHVDERGQAAARLEREQAAALAAVGDMVMCFRAPDLKVAWLNEAAASSLRVDAEGLVWKACYEALRGFSEPCPGCPVLQAFATCEPQLDRHVDAQGRTATVRAYPILDAQRQVTGVIKCAAYLPECRGADGALGREFDLTARLIEASAAFIVAIDRDGSVALINEAMLRATGYEREDVLGRDYLSVFVPTHARDKLSELFESIKATSGAAVHENPVLTADGRQLLVEWHGRAIRGDDGRPGMILGVGTDIT